MIIIFWIVVSYLVIVWIGLRLIVPNLGFKKQALPETIPAELTGVIQKLNTESKDDLEYLTKAYTFITSKYRGGRIKTITNFWVAFQDPIIRPAGFLPCTSQNYLLRLILVKSGRFKDSDIEIRVIPLNLFIHQYLRVRVGEKTIAVDPWSAFWGVPLGKKSAFVG